MKLIPIKLLTLFIIIHYKFIILGIRVKYRLHYTKK